MPATGAGNVFIAAFGANGSHIWSNIFANGYGFDVVIDESGNSYLAGTIADLGNVGGGLALQDSWFLAKYGPDGTHLWSQLLNAASGFIVGLHLAVASNGDVIAAGEFQSTINFGGGLRDSAGQGDMFVTRFDAIGNPLWDLQFGDADAQSLQAIATSSDGGAIVAGTFRGTVDFGGGPVSATGQGLPFLLKLDSDGGFVWLNTFGEAPAFDANYQLSVDASDNIVLGGKVFGTINLGGGPFTDLDNGGDMVLAKFASTGDYLWHRGFQATGAQTVNGVGVASDGVIGVAGTIQQGPLNLGGDALQTTGPGDTDVVIGRFNP